MNHVPTAIHLLLYGMAGFLWFNRITIQHPERLRTAGPTLFLGLHRNGVLDGIAYLKAVPDAAYLVSIQLHRSLLGRAVFPGIAVARAKDRVRGITTDNAAANEHCVSHLAAGGRLFLMPEGTSGLGPRHLPFKPGAAHIAAAVLRRGTPLTLVPLAIHYERAWAWQSRAEVVVGEPVVYGLDAQGKSYCEIEHQIAASLERAGVNVDSEDELRLIEMLANLGSTLATGWSYAQCLKHLESSVPAVIREVADDLSTLARKSGALTHPDLPLLPARSMALTVMTWSVMAPVMMTFVVTNLPPLAAGRLAGKAFADERNVVGFWSAVVGIPIALIWSAVVVSLLIAAGSSGLAAAYVLVSLLGVRLFRVFRRQTVALYNALKAPELRAPYFELCCRLRGHLRGERLQHV